MIVLCAETENNNFRMLLQIFSSAKNKYLIKTSKEITDIFKKIFRIVNLIAEDQFIKQKLV